jgi:hypothetical protein
MAVPNEHVDTTTRELFNGNFSMSVKGIVQGILSNVFRKSDFETNFATDFCKNREEGYTYPLYLWFALVWVYKKCNISGKGVETK